jgi:alanine dehydrogenase
VIRGTASGRTDEEQVTVFDGTGVGLQDLACAQAVTEAIGDS